MKRFFGIFLTLMMCAAVLSASAAAEDWQAGYRRLIETGGYNDYLHNPDEEYGGMLTERDPAWDAFILYDFEDDGVPELIVRSDYAIEQADVFTWNGEDTVWAGMTGGENFFQGFLWYPEYPQAGLIVLSGGPAMTIEACTLRNGRLEKTAEGRTDVDAEGMETTGVRLDAGDETLLDLLTGTLVNGNDDAEWLEEWVLLDDLLSRGEWERLFR